MALPKVGDGEQIGDGNTNEVMNVGRAGQPVQIGGSSGTVGFYGATPVVQASAITTLATTPTATDIATAVNSIIAALSSVGITA